jgi:hypothetical protein
MVVDDFHIFWPQVGPTKAKPPSIVDPDAVEAASIATQRLQTVSGRGAQKIQGLCGIQHRQFPGRDPGDGAETC